MRSASRYGATRVDAKCARTDAPVYRARNAAALRPVSPYTLRWKLAAELASNSSATVYTLRPGPSPRFSEPGRPDQARGRDVAFDARQAAPVEARVQGGCGHAEPRRDVARRGDVGGEHGGEKPSERRLGGPAAVRAVGAPHVRERGRDARPLDRVAEVRGGERAREGAPPGRGSPLHDRADSGTPEARRGVDRLLVRRRPAERVRTPVEPGEDRGGVGLHERGQPRHVGRAEQRRAHDGRRGAAPHEVGECVERRAVNDDGGRAERGLHEHHVAGRQPRRDSDSELRRRCRLFTRGRDV